MARPRRFSDLELLEAARSCLLEHGPGVSTSLIAERLGVSQAALFKRFGTKEELMFAALIPDATQGWIAELGRGPDRRALREQLTDIAAAVTSFLRRMVPCFSVLRASGVTPEMIHARMGRSPEVGIKAMTGWFERAEQLGMVRAGNAHHRALQFMGALQIKPFLSHVWGTGDDDAEQAGYIADLVETLCRGLASEQEQQ